MRQGEKIELAYSDDIVTVPEFDPQANGYWNYPTFMLCITLDNIKSIYDQYTLEVRLNGLFDPETAREFIFGISGAPFPSYKPFLRYLNLGDVLEYYDMSQIHWPDIAECMNGDFEYDVRYTGGMLE